MSVKIERIWIIDRLACIIFMTIYIGSAIKSRVVDLNLSFVRCGLRFLPPVWFICSSDLTHLLMVINSICNFLIYCWLNPNFKTQVYKIISRNGRNRSQINKEDLENMDNVNDNEVNTE